MLKNFKSNFSFLIKGLIIGTANIIPGVSGGTMALALGIYKRLIAAINNLSYETLKLTLTLFTFKKTALNRFKEEIKKVDAFFLFLVIIGVGISIKLLSGIMGYLLNTYHDITNGFFLGLILASIIIPFNEIKKIDRKVILLILIGIVIVVSIEIIQTDQNLIDTELAKQAINAGANNTLDLTVTQLLIMALTGALSFSAMILPGISGALIAVLMGQYNVILEAIDTFNIPILVSYAIGAIFGLKVFARLISYLFGKFHDLMLGFLTGLVIGSLYITWPFKREIFIGTEKLYLSNALPNTFGLNEVLTVLAAFIGIFIVLAIKRLGNKEGKNILL